jgi:TolB-like protein
MRLILITSWIAFLLPCAAVRANDSIPDAAKRQSIAVMSLVGQGVDSMSAKIVTDALSDELHKTGKFRVMERSQMEAILKEQGFQASGACDGTECAMEVGKLLSVDNVVVGCLGKLGESFTLTARTVNITTGEVVASSYVMQRGAIDQVVADALPKVSSELAGLAKPGDRQAGKGQEPPPPEEKKGGTWGWWVAGGVVVAGGVAAALLLLPEDDKSTSPANNDPPGGDTSWKTTVEW